MKHLIFLIAMLCCTATGSVLAQTPAETLEKAVTDYNALRTYIEGLEPKTLTDAQVADCKARMDKGLPMLDQVIREGNSDEIKTARYFRVNFQYQYSFVLGMKGQNKQSLEVMRAIEREFTSFTSSDFPLRYIFTGKSYIINWENFAPTQAEYYTGFGEVLYNLSYYEDAVRVSRIAVAHPNSTEWLQYIAANKLLDINAKNNMLIPAQELEELALKSIRFYDLLAESSKKTAAENNYPKVQRGMNVLLTNVQQNANPTTVSRCAEAAPLAAKYEVKNTKVLQLYEAAYRNGYASADKVWHQAAAGYAQTLQIVDRQRAEYVGQSAADRIAQLTALNDCEGLARSSRNVPRVVQAQQTGRIPEKGRAMRGRSCAGSQKSGTGTKTWRRQWRVQPVCGRQCVSAHQYQSEKRLWRGGEFCLPENGAGIFVYDCKSE
jgi:hypothetical protein